MKKRPYDHKAKAAQLRENARRGSAFYRKLMAALAGFYEKLAAEQQSTPLPESYQ